MIPRNDNWKARCEAGFYDQTVMKTLGVTIVSLAPGRVTLAMPFRADFTQHHGFLHAGTVTTVLDSACGFAAFTLMAADAEVLTIEFKSNFIAPAKGKLFRFEGEVVKSGRTITVTQGRAFADDALISTMQATMMATSL